MSTFKYARQNVGNAVAELTKEGTRQERLSRAAAELANAPSRDLPDDLKSHLDDLHTRLTVNGSLSATVASLTDQEAANAVSEIVTLYARMWRYSGQQERV